MGSEMCIRDSYSIATSANGPIIGFTVYSTINLFSGATHELLHSRPHPNVVGHADVGDIDGDGFRDIAPSNAVFAVCLPQFAGDDVPLLRVLSGTDLSILHVIDQPHDLEFASRCPFNDVRGGGDFNGDGVPDIVSCDSIAHPFPAPMGGSISGVVSVYSGRTGSMLTRIWPAQRGQIVKDVDSDGCDELISVNPFYVAPGMAFPLSLIHI